MTNQASSHDDGEDLIDWDLNFYLPENEDEDEDEFSSDSETWTMQVYAYAGGSHMAWGDPLVLSADEITEMDLDNDSNFEDEDDVWLGLGELQSDFSERLPARLVDHFDKLPKYLKELATDN